MVDNKVITLTEDDKEVALKTLKNAMFAVQQLHGWIKEDSLTEDMKETLPNLIEYHMADISKIIGFDSLSAAKVEERHGEIRKANEKIRELEDKLGNANPIDGLKEQLKGLSDAFKDWWRIYGFGYVIETRFTEYGRFEATLGFSFNRSSVFSRTPVTERKSKEQWLNELKEKGYQIYKSKSGNDKELIDCPKNRELLTELLTERFPSVIIEGIKAQLIYDSNDLFEIHNMKIDISDLMDLERCKKEINQLKEQTEEA